MGRDAPRPRRYRQAGHRPQGPCQRVGFVGVCGTGPHRGEWLRDSGRLFPRSVKVYYFACSVLFNM